MRSESFNKPTRNFLRAFVAVDLDEATRRSLAEGISKLKSTEADIKWVGASNLHLTLKFLGNIAAAKLERTVLALKTVKPCGAFSVGIGGIGALPNLKRPRVIYADVISGGEELKALAGRIDEALGTAGYERERREFLPHVTIGRVNSFKNLAKFSEKMNSLSNGNFGKISVDVFYLIKSVLRPGGPVYEKIAVFPLV